MAEKSLELVGELEVIENTRAGSEGDVTVFIRGVDVGRAILGLFQEDLDHDLPPRVCLLIQLRKPDRKIL